MLKRPVYSVPWSKGSNPGVQVQNLSPLQSTGYEETDLPIPICHSDATSGGFCQVHFSPITRKWKMFG